MNKSTTSIHISQKEYDLFAQIMPDEDRFQCSYEEWAKTQEAANAQRIAQGYTIIQSTVSYRDFIEYCKAAGLQPSYHVLGGFAVKQANKDEQIN